MAVVFLLFVALINILLGVVVYVSNPNRDSNRAFLALTVVFSLWTFANYWTTNNGEVELIYPVRATIFLACFISLFVWLAVKTFPDQQLKSIKSINFQIAYVCIVSILTLTPLVFEDAAINDGISTTKVGPLVPMFGLLALGFISGAVVSIIGKYRRSTGSQKQQALVVLFGIGGTFLAILFTNFVLVLFFDVGFFLSYTPAFSLIFSFAFAYGISKHRLYEFRALVAKAVSYLIVLSTVIVVPALMIAILINSYVFSLNFSYRIGITTLLVVVLVSIHGYIKTQLNIITSRFFFRDSYDTQSVLNQLSELLVRTIRLEEIMHQSMSIISASIKPAGLSFVVVDDDSDIIYRQENNGLSLARQDTVSILKSNQGQILIVSQLGVGRLKNKLSEHDIGLVARLVSQDHLVGYVILGHKSSGSIYSSQDIKLLQTIANELGIAIQNARNFEQIQEFNITLQKKIEDATHRLQHSNQKLKALDEAKDEFISMASHQLRTPLTSVKGYVSMVLEGDAGKVNPKQAELLSSAFTSSQRMVYLIADLLNVSRLKTGKFVIESKEVYLPDVIEGEIRQLAETAKNRKLRVNYKKPKKFPTVMLDETKIRQVIMNFADNAIYYTPAGGKIDIILEYDKKSITYKVVDNGIGVPMEERHKLFSKFYRAGNARKARPDGTGLGLFMAKKVVIAQGGAIIFESKVGKGSTFGFTFPLAGIEVKQ